MKLLLVLSFLLISSSVLAAEPIWFSFRNNTISFNINADNRLVIQDGTASIRSDASTSFQGYLQQEANGLGVHGRLFFSNAIIARGAQSTRGSVTVYFSPANFFWTNYAQCTGEIGPGSGIPVYILTTSHVNPAIAPVRIGGAFIGEMDVYGTSSRFACYYGDH